MSALTVYFSKVWSLECKPIKCNDVWIKFECDQAPTFLTTLNADIQNAKANWQEQQQVECENKHKEIKEEITVEHLEGHIHGVSIGCQRIWNIKYAAYSELFVEFDADINYIKQIITDWCKE